MSRIKDFNGILKLSICKKGKTEQEEEYNWQKRRIENKVVFFIGSTGSGKTTAKFTRTMLFKNVGYTCISLTEKSLNPFEIIAMSLPVKEEYHLSLLRMQSQKPMTKEELDGMVKIWHPIFIPDTKKKEGQELHDDFFKRKHFPINWFCYPVRMPEEVLMAILMGNADKEIVRVCKPINDELQPHEDIWDMVDKISSEISNKKYTISYDERYMGASDVGMVGNKRTVENISSSFYTFRENYFLQPDIFNLEFEVGRGDKTEKRKVHFLDSEGILEILNDNKHIHHISTAGIPDQRSKYVVLIYFLLQLADAIKRDKVKHPIYLNFDEIRNLLPKVGNEQAASFTNELAKLMGKLLKELRNSGKGVTSDLFTQEYFKTHPELTGSASSRHIMKCSLEDRKVFIRDFQYTKDRIELLEGLQVGECFLEEEQNEHSGVKFLIAMPPCGIPEEDMVVSQSFEREYPERMENYSGLFRALKENRSKIEEKVKRRFDEKIQKRIEEEERKKIEKEEQLRSKIQKGFIEKSIKTSKSEQKEKKKEEAYLLKKANPKMQFTEIARQLSISDPTSRTYVYEWALKVRDFEFLRSEGKEFMIPKEE